MRKKKFPKKKFSEKYFFSKKNFLKKNFFFQKKIEFFLKYSSFPGVSAKMAKTDFKKIEQILSYSPLLGNCGGGAIRVDHPRQMFEIPKKLVLLFFLWGKGIRNHN